LFKPRRTRQCIRCAAYGSVATLTLALSPSTGRAQLQRGLDLALFSPTLDQRRLDFTLDNAVAMGVDHISVNSWWFQNNINSTTIAPDFTRYSATDDTIRQVIDAAHARGMAVQVRPIVDLASDPSHWRGQIVGGSAWFNNSGGYGDYIRHMADIAQEKHAEIFSMGVELEALQNQEASWRSLVSSVRSRYGGSLVYGANWGNPAIGNPVQWWDAVDYVGIDAYYPLTTINNPTPAQLQAAWNNRANLIESWRNSVAPDKQVLFTEAGYQALDGANTNPPGVQSGVVDMREQAECYQALLQAMTAKPWFGGVYWWANDPANTHPGAGDFDNFAKPAYDVMGSYNVSGYTVGGNWTGATSANFTTASNWSDNVAPGNLRAVTFNGPGNGNTNITLGGANVTVARLVFDTPSAAAYTFQAGGTLTFNAGGGITITDKVSTTQTFNNAIALLGPTVFANWSTLANQRLIVNGPISAGTSGLTRLATFGNGSVSLAGNISDGIGTITLFKGGDGTLTVSGSNSYSGETYVSTGNLTITNSNALGSTAGGTVVADAASLQLAPGVNVGAERLSITGVGNGGQGALQRLDAGPYDGVSWGGTIEISGSIVEIHNRAFNPATWTNVLTLAGKITGGSSGTTLRLRSGNSNPGFFLLTNPDNDYLGTTQIAGGKVLLGGGDDTLPVTTVVQLDTFGRPTSSEAGILDLNGTNQAIAGLTNIAQPTPGRIVNRASGTTKTLTINTTGSYNFTGQILDDGGGILAVAKAGSGQQTFSNSNSYSGGTTVSGGTLTFAHIYAAGTGTISVSGGAAVFQPGLFAAPKALAMATSGTGRIDLNDNDLIVGPGTSKTTIENMVASARNGGNWLGGGLTSSTARNVISHNTTLGVLSGAEYASASAGTTVFSGRAFDPADTLVKYTYYGDTDFNGRVNFDDYVRTDNGFNNGLFGWLNGDFDLNQVVNFDDYVLIDLAFNTQSGTLRRALSFLDGSDTNLFGPGTEPAMRMVQEHFAEFGADYASHFIAAVPEPCGVGLIMMLLTQVGTRRRRAQPPLPV
jgi:autotransporter-associated beta strand protein